MLATTTGGVVLALAAIGCAGATTAAAGSRGPAPGTIKLRVASVSMEPTLKPGATITVDLHAYSHKGPLIGDIIVFHPPTGADSDPPVCAAPRQGLDRNRGGTFPQACGRSTPHKSGTKLVERVVGLPGDKIKILNGHVIRNGVRERDSYIAGCDGARSCDFPKPIVVPRGQYFTLGDNRGDSDDGRFWGPIHRSWVLGKVIAHT